MVEYTSSIIGSNTYKYDVQMITIVSQTLFGAIRTLVADGSGNFYIGFYVINLANNAISLY